MRISIFGSDGISQYQILYYNGRHVYQYNKDEFFQLSFNLKEALKKKFTSNERKADN